MEEKKNMTGESKNYNKSKSGNGSGIIIFLAILAILLAIGGGLLLRQLLSARYEAQVMSQEVTTLSNDKVLLRQQLDELDAKYAQLSVQYADMETSFNAERRRVGQLRAQLNGEPSGSLQNVAEYKQRIKELEEQLESLRMQLAALENEKQVLTGENAQIRTTLAQTTVRNQQLETENQEMAGQLAKASILTITDLEGTAMRERRRGDEPTTKAKKTDKLRVCFNINQNLVAKPGNRDFFIRLIDPSNQVLTLSPDNTIVFEGETIQYTNKRTINYQNTQQEVCIVWAQADKFQKGYYNVVVFSEGKEVGYKLFQLE
jgi:regulator of replication initiation timing